MKIKLEDMSWPEVEELQKAPHALLLPVGSVEQHGRHLPLSVDSRCATYIAEQAARKVTSEHAILAVVAPAIHYAETETTSTFAEFPGTIGLSVDTTAIVIEEICRSVIKNGFENVIFVNGHWPNQTPIYLALRKVSIDYPETGLYAVNWWSLGFDTVPGILKSEWGWHADELETSVSLVIQPENVQLEKAVREFPSFSLSSRWVIPPGAYDRVLYHSRNRYPEKGKDSGVMGDPTVATRETGEKIISAVVDDLAKLIVEIVKWENVT